MLWPFYPSHCLCRRLGVQSVASDMVVKKTLHLPRTEIQDQFFLVPHWINLLTSIPPHTPTTIMVMMVMMLSMIVATVISDHNYFSTTSEQLSHVTRLLGHTHVYYLYLSTEPHSFTWSINTTLYKCSSTHKTTSIYTGT